MSYSEQFNLIQCVTCSNLFKHGERGRRKGECDGEKCVIIKPFSAFVLTKYSFLYLFFCRWCRFCCCLPSTRIRAAIYMLRWIRKKLNQTSNKLTYKTNKRIFNIVCIQINNVWKQFIVNKQTACWIFIYFLGRHEMIASTKREI